METIRFLCHHSLSSCSRMWRDPLWTFPRRSQQLKPVIYLLLLWQICRSHCLRHLNSCSLLWFCLINILCIFSFPPTSHKTHRKSFFFLRKKQRLLMAVYVYCEREILISTYTIFIYIVNPIYKYISSQLFFWHSFLSLSFFPPFFSSFCLHFSASELLAVIYNVEWGGFRWRELKLNGAEKKRFSNEKKV